MKVRIDLDLDNEGDLYLWKVYQKAHYMQEVIDDYSMFMRSTGKHGDEKDQSWENAYESWYKILRESEGII